MNVTRREFLTAVSIAAATRSFAAELAVPAGALALKRAVAFLWSKQHDDGSWRSEVYGMMRTGQALTPFVLDALLAVPAAIAERSTGGVERGLQFLRDHAGQDGCLGRDDPDVLEYPVYSTSYALKCLAKAGDDDDEPLAARMLDYLVAAQYAEQHGFTPTAPEYGGWGFDKPPGQGRAAHMDLAHTRHALEGLAAATRRWPRFADATRTARDRAQDFLRVVQKDPQAKAPQRLSLAESIANAVPAPPAPPFDGGFYLSPRVLEANKGGLAATPTPHWRSYATATCDGVLALLAAGVLHSDERVTAAAAWLQRHDDVDSPQGIPRDDPEPWGDAVRFYHYAVRGEAYRALDFPRQDRVRLATAVAARQRDDGSFKNLVGPLMKEDDPLVATTLAVAGLVAC